MTRRQKIQKLAQAVSHLKKALALLTEISEDPSNSYFLTADAGYYKHEVAEMLSCDHGQAGLAVFVEILINKVALGYFSNK